MRKKDVWYDEGKEEERRYPDFIRESRAAYKVSANPVLGQMLLKKQGEYTIEDYYALPDQCRVELIDGVIYNMAAPNYFHQVITFQMALQLDAWIKKKKGTCMVIISPADVQLDKDDKTMVQPDLFVVCSREKIRKQVLYGEPDFVAEVLSPANTWKEQMLKYQKYKDAGVREYWVVNPQKERVMVYDFAHGKEKEEWTFDDEIPVNIFDREMKIDFADVSKALKFLSEE